MEGYALVKSMANAARKYSSTVFMCDVSPDTRYVRCDFNQCAVHKDKERSWILNTVKNVKYLEKHVGESIASFIEDNEEPWQHSDFETEADLLSDNQKHQGLQKILVVFNLRNYQSQLGVWMHKFLRAAIGRDGVNPEEVKLITLSFASRNELLSAVDKLSSLVTTAPNAQVLVMLSCHSSSQGQVFSCTPAKISCKFKFEEFCSVHDFVRSVQDVLQDRLQGIHISSCFALKMDCSHVDWPVDHTWLKRDLRIPLSGSAREVYETGSQVADLYLALTTMVNHQDEEISLKSRLQRAVSTGVDVDFPDLAKEMGLVCLDGSNVQDLVSRPSSEDKVTSPTEVVSSVAIVLLNIVNESVTPSASEALSEAIWANLKMRKQSDIRTYCHIITLSNTFNGNALSAEMASRHIDDVDVFYIVLNKASTSFCLDFIRYLNDLTWSKCRGIYGVHFHSLAVDSASQLKRLMNSSPEEEKDSTQIPFDFTVTGCVEESLVPSAVSFTLLLYMIHLSVGENGYRTFKNDTRPPNTVIPSSWSLLEVYSETSYVLSGLSTKCGLLTIHGAKHELEIKGHSHIVPQNITTEHSLSDLDNTRRGTSIVADSILQVNTDEGHLLSFINTKREERQGSCGVERLPLPPLPTPSSFSSSNGMDCDSKSSITQGCSPLSDISGLKNSATDLTPQVMKKDFLGCQKSTAPHAEKTMAISDIVAAGDLPLMANVDEVLVTHYILDLSVNFETRVIHGTIILFLKTIADIEGKNFQMCLDSSLTTVQSVEEIELPEEFELCFHGTRCCCPDNKADDIASGALFSSCKNCAFVKSLRCSELAKTDLHFKFLPYSVGGWCIRVWKSGTGASYWPKCVRISYTTSPDGPSLEWSRDQDDRPCVFTPGAYINNRSFMPCQEPPVAMSTWQAFIKVPRGCQVLMSGNAVDCCPVYSSAHQVDVAEFYYEMPVPLPCTTLALAVGYFSKGGVREITTPNKNEPVELAFYAAPSMLQNFVSEFQEVVGKFLVAACDMLGEYPFSRLDFILMPPNFACMGLKSPNLAFLSQSVLCGDGSMAVRLAHEISHAWFGLLLGAKDWTEEWLSEGFATYMEDRIQATAMKWRETETNDRCDLRRILRRRVLMGEIQEAADDNMKQLRPERKGGNYLSAVEAVKISEMDGTSESQPGDKVKPHTVVKWGAIPSRKWTQVHYIKGYFLLHYMSTLVGVSDFDLFLKYYIETFSGTLVTSEMFFDLFIARFNLSSHMKESLIKEWLESPGMPKVVESYQPSKSNSLVSEVEKEFQWWKNNDTANKRCKSRGVKRRKMDAERPALHPEQLVYLLEKLLEKDSFATKTLSQLFSAFNFHEQNAEVRHRWCELVVKHKYARRYCDVEKFLRDDQGMGIYLFGELMISESLPLQRLARSVFADMGDLMDRCTYQTVYEMLHGI